jgi:hypothetical protein
MAHLCRVLAAGRLPGRPGYPVIPDAWFTLRDFGEEIGSYGGLAFPPQLWEAIVEQWEKDSAAPVVLEARTAPELDKGISDRWHIFLPGADCPYERQYIPHHDAENVRGIQMRIMALLKSTMAGKSFAALQCVEVHLPGNGMLLPSSKAGRRRGLVIPTAGKDLNTAFQPLADLLAKWKKRLAAKPGVPPAPDGLALFPQFLSIRPVFGEYTLIFPGLGREVIWDPDSTSLEQFRRIVADEMAMDLDGQFYSPAASWVGLFQGHPKAPGSSSPRKDHSVNKPRLLVGPTTTDTEWQLICQMIVEPFVSVLLVPEDIFPRKLDQQDCGRYFEALTCFQNLATTTSNRLGIATFTKRPRRFFTRAARRASLSNSNAITTGSCGRRTSRPTW